MKKKEKLWIATTNTGKQREITLQLKELTNVFCFYTLKDLATYSPPEENGSTFLENAEIKARSLHAICPQDWVLAEDSGLVVPGLNGLPGIHSARYAGARASDPQNIDKLLKMMRIRCGSQWEAHFVCSLVVAQPKNLQKKAKNYIGELKGKITAKPAGKQGFGYDPVFIPAGETHTLAELGEAYKLKYSHRAQALSKFIDDFQRERF